MTTACTLAALPTKKRPLACSQAEYGAPLAFLLKYFPGPTAAGTAREAAGAGSAETAPEGSGEAGADDGALAPALEATEAAGTLPVGAGFAATLDGGIASGFAKGRPLGSDGATAALFAADASA